MRRPLAALAALTLGCSGFLLALTVAEDASARRCNPKKEHCAPTTSTTSPTTTTTTTPPPVDGWRLGTLETGDFSEFDQANASPSDGGSLSVASDLVAVGGRSARAYTPAGRTNATKYARAIFEPSWSEGADVWYGCSLYLPRGFYAAQQGYVAMMRWDNWGARNVSRGGIVVWGSDKKARLIRERSGVESQQVLVGPFELTEGKWHDVVVHQRFSQTDGSALNEVFVDGVLQGRSTARNHYGEAITRMRYGLVAVDDSRQSEALELRFDDARLRTS